jgi:hypothetical protein
VGRRLLGETLGEQGREFTRQAVETLTAWGKSAYRVKDNVFVSMLTDGTNMEGYVCKKDGYFGPKGRILTAGHSRAKSRSLSIAPGLPVWLMVVVETLPNQIALLHPERLFAKLDMRIAKDHIGAFVMAGRS